jgi:fructokinase
MKTGIISYGEAFIDYISTDKVNYNKYIGGTTINVSVGLQRLGTPVYYLSKFGIDEKSQFVKSELLKEKVNLHYCFESPTKKVSSVYVHILENGDRSFHAYENKSPDDLLFAEELNDELFEAASLFYFGSGTLFHPVALQTTRAAVRLARKHKTLIAFDPNIRMKRWESEEQCRSIILDFLKSVDILKLSDQELTFLMKSTTVEEGLQMLSSYTIPYVWVTLGEEGALAVHGHNRTLVQGEKVEVVDTTGAGDAFMAGILHCIQTHGLPKTTTELIKYTMFGNHLGGLAVTQQGALTAIEHQKGD